MKLEQGDDAPDFELEDHDGNVWRLKDLRGRRVVIYFYPADDTPGCTAQACDFRDTQDVWTERGYTVLGISPQGAKSHQRFASKYGLNFPLLVDEDLAVAGAFGATKPGVGRTRVNRSTFVIDEDGRIERALYGVKARGHVEALRESLGV